MKRVLAILVTMLGCGVLAVFATGASNDTSNGPHYWVEFDDAFGLITGGDVKIAGVRAGKIGEMKVDEKTHRALVEIEITKTGFGSIRTDVTCQARPQSLIGEYFVDCQPGTAPTELKPKSIIPVTRTSSVVAPDLVNNVLRRPYRERFSIIVNELGAAVAGNAQNLNDAIKRASPGLQETDKVLHILAQQNHVLADLVKNADTVIGDLSDNRKQVARWVVMADRASSASVQRRSDIAAGFNKLPGFLEQLQPAMLQLGRVADEQTPALKTLSDAAPNLKTFFDRLAPFSEVSRPAFKALGQASDTGRKAVDAALPTVQQLGVFAKGAPELGKNLNIVLKHLNDRTHAAEADPRSPGGKGYTGLEALLEYVYDQVLSVNIYDSSVHILKVSPFVGDCAGFADVTQALKPDPDGKPLNARCGASLGPHSSGINSPDTTRPDGMPSFGPIPAGKENPFSARGQRAAKSRRDSADTPVTVAPQQQAAPAPTVHPDVPTLADVVPGAPNVVIPTPPKSVQDITKGQQAQKTQTKLLDYLLGA
jgi:virulence factor Mce-like protein